jgi:molybdate transport system regulatory protein
MGTEFLRMRGGSCTPPADPDCEPLRGRPAKGFTVGGTFWLNVGGCRFLDHSRVDLLREIQAAGSIAQAARNVGVSYKWAWEAITEMNAMAGTVLVVGTRGGREGGGSRLTVAGLALTDWYGRLEAEHRRCLESLGSPSGCGETVERRVRL